MSTSELCYRLLIHEAVSDSDYTKIAFSIVCEARKPYYFICFLIKIIVCYQLTLSLVHEIYFVLKNHIQNLKFVGVDKFPPIPAVITNYLPYITRDLKASKNQVQNTPDVLLYYLFL